MTMTADLITRLESADGPSRELDWLIECTVNDHARISGPMHNDPRYTASIDAALTLVPAGYDWAVFHTNGGITLHAWCGDREDRFGATPALALAAAALKARGV